MDGQVDGRINDGRTENGPADEQTYGWTDG